MHKYLKIIKLTIQDIFQYRFNFFVHVAKYALAVSLTSLVWLAVQETTQLAEFNPQQIVLYFLLAAVLYNLSNFHTWQIEEDIKQGSLSKYLLKPISYYWHYFFYQLTYAGLDFGIKAITIFPLIFWLDYNLQPSWLELFFFIIYLPLIFFFSYCLQFITASMAFWLKESYSLRWLSLSLSRFLAGIIVPLNLIPGRFVEITFWLPFQHLAFTPIQILLGQISFGRIVAGFLILSFWSGILWYLKNLIWQKGAHSYESVGI